VRGEMLTHAGRAALLVGVAMSGCCRDCSLGARVTVRSHGVVLAECAAESRGGEEGVGVRRSRCNKGNVRSKRKLWETCESVSFQRRVCVCACVLLSPSAGWLRASLAAGLLARNLCSRK
jgi:hypothetical protein